MSLDLQLLVVDSHPAKTIVFSHTMFACEQSEVFASLRKLKGRPVSKWFNSYCSGSGDTYGRTLKDPYGFPLKYVTAKTLRRFAKHPGVAKRARNRAIWAYFAACPDDLPVVLFWH